MNVDLKHLTIEMIEDSPEVQSWLRLFPEDRRAAAVGLLTHLQFVPRDAYSEWLKSTLRNISVKPCALYAVRKFKKDFPCIWDQNGKLVGRPSSSLGSEDLVHSVISNLKKSNSTFYLDHPSLENLRTAKVHNIVLIDDSIGSGDRVASFIEKMMSSKTFLSWWSFGLVRIQIVSFTRTYEAETRIIHSTKGSDHPLRKNRKSKKFNFISYLVYNKCNFSSRWGENYQSIIDLCNSITAIPADRRMGYDSAMTNTVFYHSVPNNIPGMLWFENERWNPLFPRRSVPEWLPSLLEGITSHTSQRTTERVSEGLLAILRFTKRGIRHKATLAREMGLDIHVLEQILSRGRDAGFLTVGNRLTKAGLKVVWEEKQESAGEFFDRSLYIPQSWCVGRGTAQPSGLGGARRIQTDSADD